LDYIYILIGLIGLYIGGEGLVRGAVAMAERSGISKLIIGLTIVGMGTSAPELLVSLQAALAGKSDIALGNVVGSNIANILLILGISALVYPISHWDKNIRRDAMIALGAALFLFALAQSGTISRLAGMLLTAGLIVYLTFVYLQESKKPRFNTQVDEPAKLRDLQPNWLSAAFVVGGLVFLVFGADFLVTGASNIARSFGISEAVIGLTVVAVGTSLPELATSVMAAIKRHSDVSLGNVIGSNIFNLLGILGITAMISPVSVNPAIARFDMPLLILLSFLVLVYLIMRHSASRTVGATLVVAYFIYTLWLFV
jgi:cation:H+ antiporter